MSERFAGRCWRVCVVFFPSRGGMFGLCGCGVLSRFWERGSRIGDGLVQDTNGFCMQTHAKFDSFQMVANHNSIGFCMQTHANFDSFRWLQTITPLGFACKRMLILIVSDDCKP